MAKRRESDDAGAGDQEPDEFGTLRLAEPAGRWLVLTAVLGSGLALLDSTVINVALPAIDAGLDAGVAGLQWTVNGYLLTLSAFLLVGGSLGDLFGRRRIFRIGAWWFALASLLCGLAPNIEILAAARGLQGVGGALLTPGSLALIQATIHPDDRGRAIGAWSGASGVAAAIGPLLGGWMVESLGWRWVFLLNLPLAALTLASSRKIPESRAPRPALAPSRPSEAERERSGAPASGLDWAGAMLAVVGLGGITLGLIEAEGRGLGAWPVLLSLGIGVTATIAFIRVERRHPTPMLPLELFRSRTFSGANLVTFCAYAALGGMFFFFVLYLQVVAGYSPMQAGLSLLPISLVMFLLSSRAGALAARIGARLPMTIGCIVAASGMFWLSGLDREPAYLSEVLPAVALFSVGLVFIAVPVTVAVLAAVSPGRAGVASGVNNAVARAAGLLAVAALPLVTGLTGDDYAQALARSFPRAMIACAALLLVASMLTWLLVRDDGAKPDVRLREPSRSSCPIAGPPLEAER